MGVSPVGVVNMNTSPHFVVVVLTTNISDNFSISLIASTFKHTNQVAMVTGVIHVHILSLRE